MKTVLRLLAFLRPYRGWAALSVLLGTATIAANIGLLGTSAYLIARAALHPSIAELEVAIVGVRFFGISRSVGRYLERLVSHSVNFALLGRLRVWFYEHIEPLAPARLQDESSGDLLSRAIGDIEILQEFYVRVAAPVATAAIITAGMGIYVGLYDPILALALVGGLVLSGVGAPLLGRALAGRLSAQMIQRRGALSADMVEWLQGLADLLAYNQAGQTRERLNLGSQVFTGVQIKLGWRAAMANALALLVANLTLWLVLLLGIPLVRAGRLDGVSLAVLALLTLASFEAVNTLGVAAQNFQAALPAAQRLFSLADQTPAVCDPPQALPAPQAVALAVRDLHFSYRERRAEALAGISFDLPPGKHVALVGLSGAGKSTLLGLLLRFWDVPQGAILLNGRDLRAYAARDVRARLALVLQESRLLAGSLRQNLLLARPEASDRELLEALGRARLLPWLASLPRGLDTWLGEQGAQMSGGEKQRLAITRALLRPEAALLLFDEPTSQQDAGTGRALQEMLLEFARGKSLLWITHDLASLEKMDELLVMKEGQIVERGSHAGLLARGGLYARLSGTFGGNAASME